MSATAATTGAPRNSAGRSASALMHRHVWLRLTALIAAPMFWLGVAYLGSLAALFITAFWSTNDFTGDVVRVWTTENYQQLWNDDVYRTIILRSITVAAGVTILDAVIAFPIAFYMAKLALSLIHI